MKFVDLYRRSPTSIRRRLFRDLVGIVLFATAALFLVSFLLISGFRKDLAWDRINRELARVGQEVHYLGEPVSQLLLTARDWGTSSAYDLDHPEQLTARFLPALAHVKQVSALMIANDAGGEFFLVRDHGYWLTRSREPGDSGRVTWRRWRDATTPERQWDATLDYDPRQRPWFREAVDALGSGKVGWGRPYVFFTRQVPGVTASVAWRDANGITVVAMDVEFGGILESLGRLRTGKADSGRAFLVRGDGGVYVPSGSDEAAGASISNAGFLSAARLGGPQAFDAVAVWMKGGQPARSPLEFVSEDETWWGGFSRLYAGEDALWLGVAVPAEDVLRVLRKKGLLVFLAALGLLAAGIGLALFQVARYSRQLQDQPRLNIDRARAEADIRDLIREGEGPHVEFKSTLRMNLRSGKSGKEIELAWIKGVVAFLNTEGGILLLGVADDGAVLGLDADRFESEDKCRLHFKNLFNQHVGAEYSRCVQFEIYRVEDKRVAAVECVPSREPAFVRNKNQEAFYIRSGPSNIELSISRALSYLRHRQ